MEHYLNYLMKTNKILVWDFRLKVQLQEVCTYSSDMSHLGNRNYIDFKNKSDDIRLIGTNEQISEFVDKTKIQIMDGWKLDINIKNLEMYEKNNNNLVVINLI